MKIIHSGEEEGGWSEEDRINFRKEILVNVIQCLQILLEETTTTLDLTLVNTVIRIKELDPDNEADHMLLWEFRDNVQAIWEDRAVQVSLTYLNHFTSHDNFHVVENNISRKRLVEETSSVFQIAAG